MDEGGRGGESGARRATFLCLLRLLLLEADAADLDHFHVGRDVLNNLDLVLQRASRRDDGIAQVRIGARLIEQPCHDHERVLLLGVQLHELLDWGDELLLGSIMLLDKLVQLCGLAVDLLLHPDGGLDLPELLPNAVSLKVAIRGQRLLRLRCETRDESTTGGHEAVQIASALLGPRLLDLVVTSVAGNIVLQALRIGLDAVVAASCESILDAVIGWVCSQKSRGLAFQLGVRVPVAHRRVRVERHDNLLLGLACKGWWGLQADRRNLKTSSEPILSTFGPLDKRF